MAKAVAVKEAVKESLIGSEEPIHVSTQAKARFNSNALTDPETGELFLGPDEFIDAVAPPDEDYVSSSPPVFLQDAAECRLPDRPPPKQHKIKREQYTLLFHVADRQGKGRINMADWVYFENILNKADAEYEIAFRLFDIGRLGSVKYDDFRKLYETNKGADSIPFDWDCEWAKLYIGSTKKRHDLDYQQFSQMLRGLQGERIRQAFLLFDKDGDGYIEPEDFERIILETSKHKLSDHVLDNLSTLCNISQGSKVSYANVRAFQNMIKEMDLVELIVRRACAKSTDGRITRTEFLNQAARVTRFSLFTPMEADILFHFASMDEPSGRLGLTDFAKVLDPSWRSPAYEDDQGRAMVSQAKTKTVSFFSKVLESGYNFALGSVAGAFGAFMVYPIDLVKTRMQNQRSAAPGNQLYNNSIDCFRKVVRNEGFLGLYSGVVPQLIGVAPEKAIKLTVNDLVRGIFTDKKTGTIPLGAELLAGGSAGACQVVSNMLCNVRATLEQYANRSLCIRSLPTPSRLSRFDCRSKAKLSRKVLRTPLSDRPCGLSVTSVSSVSTRERQHVCCAMSHSRPSTSRPTATSSGTCLVNPQPRSWEFSSSCPLARLPVCPQRTSLPRPT